MLQPLKLNTDFQGRLRSVLFKRIVDPVTLYRDGQEIMYFHPDYTLTNVTIVLPKKDELYTAGKFKIVGMCEGFIELSDSPDLFDASVHFPAFTGESDV